MSDGHADDVHAAPDVDLRVVEGVATIDDLDDFLTEIRGISGRTDAVVQAFDADLVVSREHLTRAAELAARAIARGDAVARDPAVEVLLYAAGRRQIDRALEMGVAEGESRVVAVAADFGDVPGTDRESADLDAAVDGLEALLDAGSTLGSYDPDRVRTFYDVSDRELAVTDGALADVVLERVALLDVEK